MIYIMELYICVLVQITFILLQGHQNARNQILLYQLFHKVRNVELVSVMNLIPILSRPINI